MKCPYCGSKAIKTIDTRDAPNNRKRRRKKCTGCKKRFSTYEQIEIKKDDMIVLLFKVKQAKDKQNNWYERKPFTKSTRYKIMRRDDFKCVLCGRSPRNTENLTLHIDHIFPVSKGGSNKMSNLRTLCRDCNLGKGNKVEYQ